MRNGKPWRPVQRYPNLPHDGGYCPHTRENYVLMFVEGNYGDKSVKLICSQCNQIL